MAFKDIGKALALVRQQRGFTQAQLADRCGMGRPQVSRLLATEVPVRMGLLRMAR